MKYTEEEVLDIKILDEIKVGWSLGEKINENIKNRISENHE